MSAIRTIRVGDQATNQALDEIRAELRKAQAFPLVLGFGSNGVGTATTAVYLFPWNENTTAGAVERTIACPRTGELSNLRLSVDVAGAGGDVSYTVRVNGRDTIVSLTARAAQIGTFVSRQGATVQVKAGDRISIVVRKPATVTTSPTGLSALVEVV